MSGIHAATDFVSYRVFEGKILSDVPDAVDDEEFPNVFALDQNMPNPFNLITNITYHISERGHVNLTVFNVQGRKNDF